MSLKNPGPKKPNLHSHYVSVGNGCVYPALTSEPGYEDRNPAEWRPATADEVERFNAGEAEADPFGDVLEIDMTQIDTAQLLAATIVPGAPMPGKLSSIPLAAAAIAASGGPVAPDPAGYVAPITPAPSPVNVVTPSEAQNWSPELVQEAAPVVVPAVTEAFVAQVESGAVQAAAPANVNPVPAPVAPVTASAAASTKKASTAKPAAK